MRRQIIIPMTALNQWTDEKHQTAFQLLQGGHISEADVIFGCPVAERFEGINAFYQERTEDWGNYHLRGRKRKKVAYEPIEELETVAA